MKSDNPVFQIVSLLLMLGPIVLFWYIDWYWIVGYYNLYFTYTCYVLYKQYNKDENYRRKYHFIIYVGLPLIFSFIGLLISVINGFEEIKEGDKDFNKNQSTTKKERVSDKTTTKDKINIKQVDEKVEYFPTGEIKIRRVWDNDIKSEEYEYDIDGNLISEYKNKEGKIEQTNYYSNGNIRFEVKKNSSNEYDYNSKNTHEYKSYWINGNLMCKSKFNYKYYDQHFPKTDFVEEKFLENGDPILPINKDSTDSNFYSSGERKETEEIKNTEIDGDLKVVTGLYKNGNTKFIKYYKSKWNNFLSKDVFDEYGKWIFYNIDGEILNERNFIYNEENEDIIEVINNRNEELYKKIIDNLKFNIYLSEISKNDKYTFYKINIEFDDEEEFEDIDLLDIHENDYTVIGKTQLSKDIAKIIRGIALTSSRNGENIFKIDDLGKIKENKFFEERRASSHYVREYDEIYKNFHYENIALNHKPINKEPLLFSEINGFLDSIPFISVSILKNLKEIDIQNNFLHCFDDISNLKPFLDGDNSEDNSKPINQIEVLGLTYDEIEVERGVYDYITYHKNNQKYIVVKNSNLEEDHYSHNSDVDYAFELEESSDIMVYSNKGEILDKFIVFLCPNKSYETTVIFEIKKDDLKNISDWMFTSIDEIKRLLSGKSNFVNCVSNDINLENTPPIILNSSSQDVLGYLANYVSEKEFVLLRRWENGDDFYDEIYVTSESSKNFRSDEFIDEFPGSVGMDESLKDDNYYNPDYFYVFEREVFNSLNLNNNKLELEVEKYKINPLI